MKITINKNLSVKTFVGIAAFGIIVALIILYSSTNSFIKVHILNTCEQTKGTVISSYMGHNSSGSNHRSSGVFATYTYTANDITYEQKDRLWWRLSTIGLHENAEIDVYYNIKNPEKSHVYHISYSGIVFSILFAALPIYLLKKRIEADRKGEL